MAELACACKQFRRAHLVAMMRGRTTAATWYWERLELMGQCCQTCSIMERIMWHHDVRLEGDCAAVLERVGELHDVGHMDGNITVYYPIQSCLSLSLSLCLRTQVQS